MKAVERCSILFGGVGWHSLQKSGCANIRCSECIVIMAIRWR